MLKQFAKMLFVLLAFFFLITPSLASSEIDSTQIDNLKQLETTSQNPVCTDQQIEIARRGCCSHHDGVCGCDEASDRIKCCDGTLSPSCKCSSY